MSRRGLSRRRNFVRGTVCRRNLVQGIFRRGNVIQITVRGRNLVQCIVRRDNVILGAVCERQNRSPSTWGSLTIDLLRPLRPSPLLNITILLFIKDYVCGICREGWVDFCLLFENFQHFKWCQTCLCLTILFQKQVWFCPKKA